LLLSGSLEPVRQAFELGQCDGVMAALDKAVQETASRAGRGELYRLAAICRYRAGASAEAATFGRAALRLAPGQGLDPFLSPPEERAWFKALLDEVPPPKPTVVERVVRVVSHVRHYRCIAPFGFCHWFYGDLQRGVPLAAAQVAGLGLNIFAFWMAEQQRDPLGYVREERVDALRLWTWLQYTGAGFGLSALAVDLWTSRKERSDAIPANP
jgi:hypothetical protein